jgi:hypothetical protein
MTTDSKLMDELGQTCLKKLSRTSAGGVTPAKWLCHSDAGQVSDLPETFNFTESAV